MNNSNSMFYNVTNTVLNMGSKLIANETGTEQRSNTRDGSNNYLILGIASLLLLIGGGVGCKYFFSLQQKRKPKKSSDIDEAITRCEEQVDIESSDVTLITQLMHEHNIELAAFLETIPPRAVTEKTSLINPEDKYHCNQGLRELRELINTYPKPSSETSSPTVESVNAYAEASSEHHSKVIALAADLLPDFYALRNEAKDKIATLHSITLS